VSRVHLLSASKRGDRYWDERAHWDLHAVLELARTDRFQVHSLEDRPEDADLILFVETSTCAGPYFQSVRRHPVFKQLHERCFVYCATDLIVPVVPGIFPSISRRDYLRAWSRAGGYVGVRERPGLEFEPRRDPTRLFSFVGSSATHPVRRRLMELSHPDALLVDTSRPGETTPGGESGYRDAMLDSAFVLCPRGGGPATFRLMETLMMGRAPVILSDEWCAPTGPDWDEFSLRVPEREAEAVPALLEANASRAAEMGRKARQAWLDWFGPETHFHRTIEWALELQALSGDRRHRLGPWLEAARPYHLLRRGRHRLRR
jgi:hypothetical protein